MIQNSEWAALTPREWQNLARNSVHHKDMQGKTKQQPKNTKYKQNNKRKQNRKTLSNNSNSYHCNYSSKWQ